MICEAYVDDCSVFVDTNIEFVSRLRSVFEQLRKYNLFVKKRINVTSVTKSLSLLVKFYLKKD